MTLKITHKHATTAGTPPATSDIDVGELAINAADAELYTKDTSGKIKKFAASERPLYGSSGALIDPQIPTGAFYSTSEYHEGSSIGGASYKVCASNSASDMGRSFYTYIDHVLPTGQVLKFIPDSLNTIKASQAGVRYETPLDGGADDTANLQAATSFVFDISGTFDSSGNVEQAKGAAVYIEGTIFLTDTIFSRSGRVTFIGNNWKQTGFRWAGSESTQPMFNMGYVSTGGFRDVSIVATSTAGASAAYCIACQFIDLGFEITRCYIGAARCDIFLLFKSFDLEIVNAGTGYSSGARLATTGGSGSGLLVDVGANSSGEITTPTLSYIGSFKYSPASADSIYDGTIVTNYQINDVVTIQGGDGNATVRLIQVASDNAITNLTFQNCFLAIGSNRNGYVVKCESGAGGKRPISFASCTVIANNGSSSKAGGLLNAVAATNKGFTVNVYSCRIEYQKENSILDATNFALVNVDCNSTNASQRTTINLSGVVGFISDLGWQTAYIARGTTAGSISLSYDGNLSGFGGIYYSVVNEDFAPKLTSTSSVSNAGGLFNDVQFGKSSIISANLADKNQSNDGWWIDRGDLVLTSDGAGDYLTSGIEDNLIYSFSSTGYQNVGKGTGTAGSTSLTVKREPSAIRLRPRLAIKIVGAGAAGADLLTNIVSVTNGNATVGANIVIANALGTSVADASMQPLGAPVRQGWLSPRSTLPSAPAATTGQGLWSQDLQAQAYYVQKDIHITTGVEFIVNKWVWGPTRAVTTAERNNAVEAFGDLLIGVKYKIEAVGNTTWTAIGGPSSPSVGDTFVATANGSTQSGTTGSVKPFHVIDYTNNRRSFVGSCVFDITLGKPVWWNKTGWVDATGTSV